MYFKCTRETVYWYTVRADSVSCLMGGKSVYFEMKRGQRYYYLVPNTIYQQGGGGEAAAPAPPPPPTHTHTP